MASSQLQGYSLTLRRDTDQHIKAYGPNGHLFGYIAKEHEPLCTSNRITIQAAKATDGNLRTVCVLA